MSKNLYYKSAQSLYWINCYFRELAHLLVRYYHDEVHLMKLLNEMVLVADGKEEVLFHELIKRMEGMDARMRLSFPGPPSLCAWRPSKNCMV
jgi:hypothetical protein